MRAYRRAIDPDSSYDTVSRFLRFAWSASAFSGSPSLFTSGKTPTVTGAIRGGSRRTARSPLLYDRSSNVQMLPSTPHDSSRTWGVSFDPPDVTDCFRWGNASSPFGSGAR